MNKTAILSFIIDEVALKCRNVSSNMRKIIHWMLKYNEVAVREYDERALIFNGWVKLAEGWGFKNSEIHKGVSNYEFETQEELERVMSLNNKVRCYSIDFKLTSPVEVESIEFLIIDQDNYDIYSKSSFNKAKFLMLQNLLTNQIKFILTRFKSIDSLEILYSSLESIDFSQSRIKQFNFDYVSFKGLVYLPKEIDHLNLSATEFPNLIRAERVNEISCCNQYKNPNQFKEVFKSLKGVKVAHLGVELAECLFNLPSTVRKMQVSGSWYKIDSSDAIFKQFPYLIDISASFPIEALEKTKLRGIYPEITQTKEKFNLRPKKIRVDSDNVDQLNMHPELFERVESVFIGNSKFNFDVLPNEIKIIQIYKETNEESRSLNRLKKECE